MNPIVNFILIIFKNIPPVLRKAKFYALMELFGRFMNTLNIKMVFELSHTGQVASLEHYLNTIYGINYAMATRTADIASTTIIWIDESAQIDIVYIFNQDEFADNTYVQNADEIPYDPVYLFNSDDDAYTDFVVKVPLALTFNEDTMKAQVRKYKQGGVRFKIETY